MHRFFSIQNKFSIDHSPEYYAGYSYAQKAFPDDSQEAFSNRLVSRQQKGSPISCEQNDGLIVVVFERIFD